MSFSFSSDEIALITGGNWLHLTKSNHFSEISTDSRKIVVTGHTLYFAIVGERYNGHDFCRDVAQKGQLYFVVEQEVDLPQNCAQLVVNNTLKALQSLAEAHRQKFKGKVIGITGSNGKTIVKEWLFELLSTQYKTYKSPKSFNSQIGVAISLLNASTDYDYYLIEAGISAKGEMKRLSQMISPELGIFTHLGKAHDEGFQSEKEKFIEKCILFNNAEKVFIHDNIVTNQYTSSLPSVNFIKVGNQSTSQINVFYQNNILIYNSTKTETIFTDSISQQNLLLAFAVAIQEGVSQENITRVCKDLKNPSMRLEVMDGKNNSTLINDTWTNDPDSLSQAMDFLFQQKKQKNTCLILSDYPEGVDSKYYTKAAKLIEQKKVDCFIGIGPIWMEMANQIQVHKKHFFSNTDLCLSNVDVIDLSENAILIKGSRKFALEKIAYRLQAKKHQTVLEINLDNLTQNYFQLKNMLNPKTKIMAMVKAFAYGSGSYETAKLLANSGVDYLAVAFADEGIALRNFGITTPIMVLNADPDAIESLLTYNLEPVVGSFFQLQFFIKSANKINIHLELDTGMHRMGFSLDSKENLVDSLRSISNINIVSIFSHLAAADEFEKDDLTHKQILMFSEFSNYLIKKLDISPLLHLNNSSGVIRFNQSQFDMVRLGIALYGIDPSQSIANKLKNVFTFKTHITQIKTIKSGEGIGYGFHDSDLVERKIAILPVGYADGFNRKLGRGKLKVLINNKPCPTVGNVCMDMCMVDVSSVQCNEGDAVILFGDSLKVIEWALLTDTIPYEILTSISQRVKRVFVSEV
jgi:alanine racemase